MRNLTELNKLEEYLKDEGIPYERVDVEPVKDEDYPEFYRVYERHQIIVPANDGMREWDAICQKWSYGYEAGLLEIMGTIVQIDGDTVEGWLSADDVIERIKKYYRKN